MTIFFFFSRSWKWIYRGTIFFSLVIKVKLHLSDLVWLFTALPPPAMNSQSRFYMLKIVSIVGSCIDVACHVNMHFQVSAEKNKEALFHIYCVHLFAKVKTLSWL